MELLMFFWLNIQFSLKQVYCNIAVCTPKVVTQQEINDITPLNKDILFQKINNWRVENGYKPYKESKLTCEVASVRAKEADLNFSHTGFHAIRFCPYGCNLSENLAKNIYPENEVLNSWLNSASHSATLKADFPYSCLAIENNTVAHIFSDK